MNAAPADFEHQVSAVSVIRMGTATPRGAADEGATGGGRIGAAARILTVAAVVLAGIGLAGLIAVLLLSAAGGSVWPGFVAVAYICLPLAFLLLGAALILGVLRRRRAVIPRA